MARTAPNSTEMGRRRPHGGAIPVLLFVLLNGPWAMSCAPEPDTLCPPETPTTCGNGQLEDHEMCDPLPQPHGTWREGVNCKTLANLGGRLTCRCCKPEIDMCIDVSGAAAAGTVSGADESHAPGAPLE